MQLNKSSFDNWDGHWSQYAAAAEANPAQAYRRRLIRAFLTADGLKRPKRIVDLGSGQGDLAVELVRTFPRADVLGLELSAAGVEIASHKAPKATFLQQDLLTNVSEYNPYRGWADYAVCSEVLEHLDNPVLFLKNAAAFMEPGCRLVVTVPGGPMSAFDKHIGHRRHYSTTKLRDILEAAGFDVMAVEAAGYPFFNLYRRTVILRGDALIEDVSARPRAMARVAMKLFDVLFTLNRTAGTRGWQMIALAQYAVSGSPSLSGSSSQIERLLK